MTPKQKYKHNCEQILAALGLFALGTLWVALGFVSGIIPR